MSIYTIYMARNKANGKSYVGFDSNWPNRMRDHKYLAPKTQSIFYAAIRKYGFDNFEWLILYQSKDKAHTLTKMENFFIEEYESFSKGYNMTMGGEGSLGHQNPRSEATKEKIRIGNSKRWEIIFPRWMNKENVQIKNLTQFCREYGLNQPHMSGVARKERKQHKGYRCINLDEVLESKHGDNCV
jgi:group I intron endonuclease